MFEQQHAYQRGAVPSDLLEELQSQFQSDISSRHIPNGFPFERLQNSFGDFWVNFKIRRFTFFVKATEHQWSLNWHQDNVIAVKDRCDVSGYSNWTRKNGVWHCEPPINVLENMFFALVLFDNVSIQDGPTEFIKGSHTHGRLTSSAIKDIINGGDKVACVGAAGDIWILPALTVHRSLPSISRRKRRQLRLDLSSNQLPNPLTWAIDY